MCRASSDFDRLEQWGWQSRTGHAVKYFVDWEKERLRFEGPRAGAQAQGSFS